MTHKVKNKPGTLLLLALAAIATLPGVSQAQEPLVKVDNLGDTLVFTPLTEFAQLILTVSGPCDFHYQQVVARGELIFRLDKTTIDGNYTYGIERIEAIDPEVVKALQEARKANDEELPRQLCRSNKLPGPPAIQSEGFQVFRGAIIYDPETTEKVQGPGRTPTKTQSPWLADALSSQASSDRGIPTKDFVINDDLIVDGSACIGFDCVNGESFGFDTIRLKENNLRIKFDDTSTAASFPRNDWQLTANDSANGGQSKFSIDDVTNARTPFTVEANARTHSLYVDDGGRIGNRTSTPSVEIHSIDGDTPTLRLQQDGSSGFAAQTWDVAGNETNFFVRDVTSGSTLPFRIRPGAPSSSLFVDTGGKVGVGTSSPAERVHVFSSAADVTFIEVENTNASAQVTGFRFKNSAAAQPWDLRANAAGQFSLARQGLGNDVVIDDATGDVTISHNLTVNGTFSNPSSKTLKTDFQAVDRQQILDHLVAMPINQWRYIADPEQLKHIGPFTEDFGAAFDLGTTGRNIIPLDVQGVTIAALQGFYQRFEQQVAEKESRINALEQENAALAARLARQEALMNALLEAGH